MFQAERFACLAVLAVVLVSAQASNDDNEYAKEKRGGEHTTMRLIAFPRVGRSDPDLMANNWDNSYAIGGAAGSTSSSNNNNYNPAYGGSLEDYETDFVVRSPFAVRSPRSGQSAGINGNRYMLQSGMKRAGSPGAANGMWFGPRLGRVQKRNSESTLGGGQTAELVAMPGDH